MIFPYFYSWFTFLILEYVFSGNNYHVNTKIASITLRMYILNVHYTQPSNPIWSCWFVCIMLSSSYLKGFMVFTPTFLWCSNFLLTYIPIFSNRFSATDKIKKRLMFQANPSSYMKLPFQRRQRCYFLPFTFEKYFLVLNIKLVQFLLIGKFIFSHSIKCRLHNTAWWLYSIMLHY